MQMPGLQGYQIKSEWTSDPSAYLALRFQPRVPGALGISSEPWKEILASRFCENAQPLGLVAGPLWTLMERGHRGSPVGTRLDCSA